MPVPDINMLKTHETVGPVWGWFKCLYQSSLPVSYLLDKVSVYDLNIQINPTGRLKNLSQVEKTQRSLQQAGIKSIQFIPAYIASHVAG